MLSQHLQDQRHATKPLDTQVPNLYRDKVLQRLKGTVKVRADHWGITQHGGSSWDFKRGKRGPVNQTFNRNFQERKEKSSGLENIKI